MLGLEALGPFVSASHLNIEKLMLQVGLDAAPLWHCANGVCEDTGLSLLHFPYLHLLSLPSPSLTLRWLTHKDPLLLFFFLCSQFTRSTEAANNPKHTSITALLNKQFSFSLFIFFFPLKCATTGLSIDWNKNNQTARADQQSRPFENSAEKPGK